MSVCLHCAKRHRTGLTYLHTIPPYLPIPLHHLTSLTLTHPHPHPHPSTHPPQVPPNAVTDALNVAKQAIASLPGAGIYGVELFLMPDDSILLNEIAPR